MALGHAVEPEAAPSSKPEVGRAAERIVARLAEMRRAEVVARFAIGDEVHAVRYAMGLENRALWELAKSLRCDISGLLKMARTSERIRLEERSQLLALTDAIGLPLVWSHYARLKDIRSHQERLSIARIVLTNSFSVEQLTSYLRARETVSGSV